MALKRDFFDLLDGEDDGKRITLPIDISADAAAMSEGELEDLKNATGGKKRGRKPGSGLGEKRKDPSEYSTNPNTVKARKRYESLKSHSLEVHAAKTADASAVSRSQKKLKKTAEFQALDEAGRQAALADMKETTLSTRTDRGYSAQLIVSEKQAMLEEQILRDEDIVERLRWLNVSPDNEEFWSETDDYESKEIKASSGRARVAGKIAESHELEDVVTHEPDMLASLLDGFLGDVELKGEKRTLTDQEQKKAFENLSKRQRLHLVATGKHLAFSFFKKEFMTRIANLHIEELSLESLGPVFAFKHFKLGKTKRYTENSAETYTDVLDVNNSWVQLIAAGEAWPHKMFSQESRGLLRCVWAIQDDDWIELPGPAELWPDEPRYYIENGFEVRPGRKSRHLQALQLLGMDEPTPGWMENVVHENDRFELVWNPAL